jgi:hypothetical protein
MDDGALLRRAFAAYFRSGGEFAMQPSASNSGLVFHNDKAYVVLRNGSDTLAVYRVRNDGILKGLRRWPAALEEG